MLYRRRQEHVLAIAVFRILDALLESGLFARRQLGLWDAVGKPFPEVSFMHAQKKNKIFELVLIQDQHVLYNRWKKIREEDRVTDILLPIAIPGN